MSKFSDFTENDSFDDILATIEIPSSGSESLSVPTEAKKPRNSTAFDETGESDEVLANITIPEMVAAATTGNDQNKDKPSTSTNSVAGNRINTSKTNCILVNPKQRGNPILKSITNIPWEYDTTIIPDYVVGATACILYLSLRYHRLNPDYIHARLKELGKRFELRILLVQIDVADPNNTLKTLTQMCLLANLTLMLAWNAEEAGKIVETYKAFETKPPDLIMARAQQYPHQKLVTALTNIKPVNKTDAITLLQNYGSLEKMIMSNEEHLSMCAGLGPRKAKRLVAIFNEPFMKK